MKVFFENKNILAFITVVILFLFIIYAGFPFINAFFGAIILFFIFKPFNKWLIKKVGFKKSIAALMIIVLSLIIILVPLFFLIQGVINQITLLPEQLSGGVGIEETINKYTSIFNIEFNKEKILEQTIPFIKNSITPLFSNILNLVAILFLMYFLLYYLLVNSGNFIRKAHKILPFNNKNSKRIIDRFSEITNATLISTFFVALIQGFMLAIGFYFLGIPNALFWGFVAAILSIIPIVGTPIIWVPATLIFFLSGNTTHGVILLVWGIVISNVDNFLRPMANRKFGKIHPVVSIIGLYIGISQFGFIGIFIGPLLVAYLLLFWEIYKKEYLK